MPREATDKVPTAVLGSRLRHKRKALKMSQHQLGGEEFSPSYISAVERGKIRPSLKALYILASRLGEPVTYFLQDDGTIHSAEVLDEIIAAATIDIYQGRPADALQKLENLPPPDVSSDVRLRVLFCRGRAYLANKQLAEAASALQEALSLADAAGDIDRATAVRLYLGKAYYQQQRVGMALDLHRRCLLLIADGTIKDTALCLQVYASLAEDLLALDQETDAMTFYEQAKKIAADTATPTAVAGKQWELSIVYRAARDLGRSRVYAQKSLAGYELVEILSSVASVYSTYGVVLQRSGQPDAAEQSLIRAQALAECLQDDEMTAVSTVRLGELYAQRGERDRGEELIKRGIEHAARRDPLLEAQGLLSLAQLHVTYQRRGGAEKYFRAAIEKLEAAQASDQLSRAYFRYGQALVAWGEVAQGSEYLEKAYLQSRKA